MSSRRYESEVSVEGFYNELHHVISTGENSFYRYYDDVRFYPQMYSIMLSMNTVLKKYRGKRILLFSSKSFEAYSAIFAILLSGNTWVPVDPELPPARILSMAELSEPSLILADRELPEELKEYTGRYEVETSFLKQFQDDGEKEMFCSFKAEPDDIAYIMFTSGSTGTPKGVPMTHRNYINFINRAMDILPFEEGEVFSDYHDFGFDISIFYLFCSVLTRGSLAPAIERNERIFPLQNLIENGVTVWSTVPSVITRFRRLRPDDIIENSLKILFLCGEPLPVDVVGYSFSRLMPGEIFNFYGLTETGVENFFYHCRPEDVENYRNKGFFPIGKPIPGNEIDICPETGELAISGVQVTPGYLGGREKDRIREVGNRRWFFTGDIAEKDGENIFLKGRVDSQVKLNGFRVELMDIEANIRRIGNMREAVCVVNQKKLICFFESEQDLEIQQFRSDLRKELPDHMIPFEFRKLDEMPLNRNGKTDRKALASFL